jgi:hypothetical protein
LPPQYARQNSTPTSEISRGDSPEGASTGRRAGECSRVRPAVERARSDDTPESGPEFVAGVIADLIEDPGAVLRQPVGADAELVISTRDSMPFEQFDATMRGGLGHDW